MCATWLVLQTTYVLHAVMAWQVSPVQNSEMVLYWRLIRLKNVVAAEMTEIEQLSSGAISVKQGNNSQRR